MMKIKPVGKFTILILLQRPTKILWKQFSAGYEQLQVLTCRHRAYHIIILMKFLAHRQTLLTILAVSFLILGAQAQDSCQLCMRTFKSICNICYDQCGSKELQSCTYKECLKRDDKDYCIEEGPEEILDSDTCLPKCCDGSGITAGFSQKKFNSCIEYDADRPNDINIGMTLGAMLSLFFLLGMFGAAYLLSILCFDQKLNQQNTHTGREIKVHTSSQLKNGKSSMLMPSFVPYWLKGEEVETRLSGPCVKCKKKGINLLTFCKHGYHSSCFIPKAGESVECLACHNTWASVLIYCSTCHKNYFDYRLKPKNMDDFEAMKCQVCST